MFLLVKGSSEMPPRGATTQHVDRCGIAMEAGRTRARRVSPDGREELYAPRAKQRRYAEHRGYAEQWGYAERRNYAERRERRTARSDVRKTRVSADTVSW
jgi:hypothetical protein